MRTDMFTKIFQKLTVKITGSKVKTIYFNVFAHEKDNKGFVKQLAQWY